MFIALSVLLAHVGNGDGFHGALPAVVALVIDVAYLAVAVAR